MPSMATYTSFPLENESIFLAFIKSSHSSLMEHKHASISNCDSFSTSFHIHVHYSITCLFFRHIIHCYHIHFGEWSNFIMIGFIINFNQKHTVCFYSQHIINMVQNDLNLVSYPCKDVLAINRWNLNSTSY